MRPGLDSIYACPHCQAHALIGTLDIGNRFASTVWSDGYGDPFRQWHLRGHLWWRFNHRYRQEPVRPPTKKEIALNQQNLTTLITMYDPQDPPAKLKCAAMLLGLERFGDAKAIAEMVEEEQWAPIRIKFIEEAEQKKSGVFRLVG